MKTFKVMLFLTFMVFFGCKEKTTLIGEPCSVKLPTIEFSQSLNNGAKNAVIENSTITIKSDPKTDYFNDPDGKVFGNAPILLSKVDNTMPFTLTTKVTPVFHTTYDAGALYLYSTDRQWQKFAFERDERAQTRIVTVRTIGTSDDNNHDVIAQPSVYLKISSDAKTIGFYYSIDNEKWNLARLYKNNYPEIVWLGISSQSPAGEGNTTAFDNCELNKTAVKDFRIGI